MLEEMVNGVGRKVRNKVKSREAVKSDEVMLAKMRERDEEGTEDEEAFEKEVERVKSQLMFPRKVFFEPKGERVDFGTCPLSLRGDMIFGGF